MTLIQESNAVLIDFYAPLRSCKAMAPIIDDIEKTYGESIQVERVDAAANPELGKAFKCIQHTCFCYLPRG